MRKRSLVCSVLCVSGLAAQSFPLPATSGDRTAQEGTAPFLVPTRMRQTVVTDRNTLDAKGLPATFSNWDMVTFDPTSRYVLVPAEVGSGAGVFRYDTATRSFVTLMEGDGSGVRESNPAVFDPLQTDYARIDPCTLTPWGSVLTGEETTGGRLFEITNPLAASGPFQVVWRSKVPAVAHEGIRLDRSGNLYFIDEDNSGSLYKFVPVTPGDLSAGQTFVLSADAFAANPAVDASKSWSDPVNRPADLDRFGLATWVPMTDAVGNALTAADPFAYVTTTGGRTAADELKGTPYGRPEDITFNVLASGNDCFYCSLTSENRVVSVELLPSGKAMVRVFVDFDTINLATGADVNPQQNDPYSSSGTGTRFNSPDNLATDAFGSIYLVEDSDPGDIWKAVDADRDGVAEAIGIFVSLGVGGAEPTGFIPDPNDPYRFLCSIQHPDSGNDALWVFDTRPYPGSNQDLEMLTGVSRVPSTGPGEFVKDAVTGDVLVHSVRSPSGALVFAPFAILVQAFPTGAPPAPFLPPLWLSPLQPIIALSGGFSGSFQYVLPPSGASTAIRVPPGVEGFSVLAQGIAISPTLSLVLTDGHEVVLN